MPIKASEDKTGYACHETYSQGDHKFFVTLISPANTTKRQSVTHLLTLMNSPNPSVGAVPGRKTIGTANVAHLIFKIDLESIEPGTIGLKSNVQWFVD